MQAETVGIREGMTSLAFLGRCDARVPICSNIMLQNGLRLVNQLWSPLPSRGRESPELDQCRQFYPLYPRGTLGSYVPGSGTPFCSPALSGTAVAPFAKNRYPSAAFSLGRLHSVGCLKCVGQGLP